MQLFMGETTTGRVGAKCVLCHVANFTPDPGNVVVPQWSPKGLVPPVFTDFTYDNLGVPINPEVYALAGGAAPRPGSGAHRWRLRLRTASSR